MNRISSDLNINSATNTQDIGLEFFKLMHKVLAFVVILWLNNGLFTYIMPYFPNILRWGSFAIWFGMAILFKPKFTKTFIAQCWPLLLFFLYVLISSIFFKESYLSMYIKNFTYLLMVYSIFLYYFDDRYKKWMKNIVIFLSIDYIFIAINTYLHLKENPQLARILSTSLETQALFLGNAASNYNAVGSFAYFYGLVPIMLLLGYLFLNKYKNRLLSLIVLICLIIVTIKASFTMAILFVFVFLAASIAVKHINKFYLILMLPFMILLMALLQRPVGMLFKKLSNVSSVSSVVSDRLFEISNLLLYTNITGDLLVRLDLYTESLDAFVHNLIFGITIPYTHGLKEGGHSTWLDLFALFGIFAFFFILFIIKAYKYSYYYTSDAFKPYVRLYWVYFACLGIVNTLLFSNLFTVWLLFIPFFIKTYFGNKENTKLIE